MDKYYYFVSQLPMLFFDRATDMTRDRFFSEAEKWVTGRDYATLSSVSLGGGDSQSPCNSRVWKKVRGVEIRFREELGLWRQAQKSGGEYRPETFQPSLLREGHPLAVEKRLLHMRWQMLDDLESDHHFDLDFLVIYALKLQILERLSSFDREVGLETFQKLSKVTV